MNLSIVKKDFTRNKLINIVLMIFILLSAFLMSIATIIIIQLFGSINAMYEIAKPPHYLQMHVGEIDEIKIYEFAKSIDYVENWQIVEMVNIYGGNICVTKPNGITYSMSDSLLDMGWVKQNNQYDLLLDMDNIPINPKKGEVGVPLLLLDRYDIELGDTITVKDNHFSMDFKVTSYVRDPQMNSALVSSTRFLIHEDDFNYVKENTGSIEYLIEFYLHHVSKAAEFQTVYEKAGMPANGQGVTYGIIRLLSGFSNILMVTMLVLVSLAMILVVFLCLRFTILTVMEEEITSLGIMKAIGMSHKDIRQIFMLKYRLLTIIGCIIGYLISLITSKFFTTNISLTFGKPQTSIFSVIIPMVTVYLVYLLEVHYSRRVMKKLKKITVVDALVNAGNRDQNKLSKMVKYLSFNHLKRLPANGVIATRQILYKRKTWLVMLFVMIITTTIMLIPLNVLSTLKSPKFITYMGQSRSDLIVSVTSLDDLTVRYTDIVSILNDDKDVKDYHLEARVKYEAINKDGNWIYIRVDHNEVSNSELQYISGNLPTNADEIALSVMNANELGVNVGDSLTMKLEDKEQVIKVTGIYQDVTSGGFTAKMVRPYEMNSVEKYTFLINLKDKILIEDKVKDYQSVMGLDVKVMDMEEFSSQTLGGVVNQLSKALFAICIMVICLVALITIFFLKLYSAKEYSQIAVMKAIGLSVLDIRKQYILKLVIVTIIGVLFGILLTNTFGEIFISSFLGIIGFGISTISFIINPLTAYLVVPSVIIIIVLLVTWYSTRSFKTYSIIDIINE